MVKQTIGFNWGPAGGRCRLPASALPPCLAALSLQRQPSSPPAGTDLQQRTAAAPVRAGSRSPAAPKPHTQTAFYAAPHPPPQGPAAPRGLVCGCVICFAWWASARRRLEPSTSASAGQRVRACCAAPRSPAPCSLRRPCLHS